MNEEELSNIVIGLAIKVHKALGPGLLESTYQECLVYEISKSGLTFENEKAMPLVYDKVKIDCGYRIDILVENKLVLETKSVKELNEIHLMQTLTYLKTGKFKLGLIINFNVKLLKEGIKRVIN